MNKWTFWIKEKGSALSSLSSPSRAAREIQRPTVRTPENYVTLGPALGKLWSTFPFLFLFLENRQFTHRNRRRGWRAARNPGALKAGIPFRGASPTLLTPPGKFKGELCGHLKTMSPLDQRWENFGAHSLFFFFFSKIVHLLIEIDVGGGRSGRSCNHFFGLGFFVRSTT